MALGAAPSFGGTVVNIVWAVYDVVVLSVVIDAVLHRGFGADVPTADHRDRGAIAS